MNLCVLDGYLTVNSLNEVTPRGTWPQGEAGKDSPKVETV